MRFTKSIGRRELILSRVLLTNYVRKRSGLGNETAAFGGIIRGKNKNGENKIVVLFLSD